MLARAVAAAHQRGVVHRDLKPGNILLAPPGTDSGAAARDGSHALDLYGEPKITDFGIAKRLDAAEGDAVQTRTGCVIGTPCYMAPEQASGRREVSPAVDVYALGDPVRDAHRPASFQGGDRTGNHAAGHERGTCLAPRLQSFVPRGLETICLKCLNKDPRKRYPSALALADDLHRYIHGEPIRPAAGAGGTGVALVPPLSGAGDFPDRHDLLPVFGFWYLSHLTDYLVRSAALESAAQQSDLLLEVNNSYSDVVKREGRQAARHARLRQQSDGHSHPGDVHDRTGPADQRPEPNGGADPALQRLPVQIARNGGPKDDFERDAWRLRRTPPSRSIGLKSTRAGRCCATPRRGRCRKPASPVTTPTRTALRPIGKSATCAASWRSSIR